METIDELTKRLQCQKCHQIYNEGSVKYVYDVCKHHVCVNCLDETSFCSGMGYECLFCKCRTYVTGYEIEHDNLTTVLEMYKNLAKKYAEVETDLRDKNSLLEQERALWKASQEHHYKCAECEKTDVEQDMQLCATCHELKFEDLEYVKKNALCPACAIKKHMRKGHQTVDFFPYLSAYHFSSHSPKIESKSAELKSSRASLCNTFSDFNALSINVSESYDVLTDMARRSKSTKNQLEFIEKMEVLINESKSIHAGADSELKERTKLLQESLTKIKDWYNARMEDCLDESEIIKLEAPVNH